MFPELLERGVHLREWEERVEGVSAAKLTWDALLELWDLVETDFQQFYHLDLAAPEVRGRSWRWFQVRCSRLLGEDTALGRATRAPD